MCEVSLIQIQQSGEGILSEQSLETSPVKFGVEYRGYPFVLWSKHDDLRFLFDFRLLDASRIGSARHAKRSIFRARRVVFPSASTCFICCINCWSSKRSVFSSARRRSSSSSVAIDSRRLASISCASAWARRRSTRFKIRWPPLIYIFGGIKEELYWPLYSVIILLDDLH